MQVKPINNLQYSMIVQFEIFQKRENKQNRSCVHKTILLDSQNVVALSKKKKKEEIRLN